MYAALHAINVHTLIQNLMIVLTRDPPFVIFDHGAFLNTLLG